MSGNSNANQSGIPQNIVAGFTSMSDASNNAMLLSGYMIKAPSVIINPQNGVPTVLYRKPSNIVSYKVMCIYYGYVDTDLSTWASSNWTFTDLGSGNSFNFNTLAGFYDFLNAPNKDSPASLPGLLGGSAATAFNFTGDCTATPNVTELGNVRLTPLIMRID